MTEKEELLEEIKKLKEINKQLEAELKAAIAVRLAARHEFALKLEEGLDILSDGFTLLTSRLADLTKRLDMLSERVNHLEKA